MNDHRRREIFREEYTRMRRDAYKSLHLKKIEIMKKALQARYESVNVQINVGDILDSRSVESASSPDVRDEDDQQVCNPAVFLWGKLKMHIHVLENLNWPSF